MHHLSHEVHYQFQSPLAPSTTCHRRCSSRFRDQHFQYPRTPPPLDPRGINPFCLHRLLLISSFPSSSGSWSQSIVPDLSMFSIPSGPRPVAYKCHSFRLRRCFPRSAILHQARRLLPRLYHFVRPQHNLMMYKLRWLYDYNPQHSSPPASQCAVPSAKKSAPLSKKKRKQTKEGKAGTESGMRTGSPNYTSDELEQLLSITEKKPHYGTTSGRGKRVFSTPKNCDAEHPKRAIEPVVNKFDRFSGTKKKITDPTCPTEARHAKSIAREISGWSASAAINDSDDDGANETIQFYSGSNYSDVPDARESRIKKTVVPLQNGWKPGPAGVKVRGWDMTMTTHVGEIAESVKALFEYVKSKRQQVQSEKDCARPEVVDLIKETVSEHVKTLLQDTIDRICRIAESLGRSRPFCLAGGAKVQLSRIFFFVNAYIASFVTVRSRFFRWLTSEVRYSHLFLFVFKIYHPRLDIFTRFRIICLNLIQLDTPSSSLQETDGYSQQPVPLDCIAGSGILSCPKGAFIILMLHSPDWRSIDISHSSKISTAASILRKNKTRFPPNFFWL